MTTSRSPWNGAGTLSAGPGLREPDGTTAGGSAVCAPPSDEAASKGRPADPGLPKGSRRSAAPAMARLRLPRRTLPEKAKCARSDPHQLPHTLLRIRKSRSELGGSQKSVVHGRWTASGLRTQNHEIKYKKPTPRGGHQISTAFRGPLPAWVSRADFFLGSKTFDYFPEIKEFKRPLVLVRDRRQIFTSSWRDLTAGPASLAAIRDELFSLGRGPQNSAIRPRVPCGHPACVPANLRNLFFPTPELDASATLHPQHAPAAPTRFCFLHRPLSFFLKKRREIGCGGWS